MTNDQDHYDAYHAEKLWRLLPAVYRALDSDQFGVDGPLRELVNRVGAQAAVLRRSLDRMWDDQSIETCDDWVIAYIGDLLATNLVANLDGPTQRLDVAKTIYYRRRKGTPAILEEIARDITGWEARVVEFFRRLGRTRHGLDPAIGRATIQDQDVAGLQVAEGLVGPITRTGIGGLADLRKTYGASRTGSAYDEFFHTADFRRGIGRVGWYDIPRLGVFLWRLRSFGVGPTTPVSVAGCPGWYTFDPTGRDVPLFAAGRTTASYGDAWVSPVEAQLPTPIGQPLYDAQGSPPSGGPPTFALYPASLAVFPTPTPHGPTDAVTPDQLTVRPPRGRVQVKANGSSFWVSYHYGFSSTIGAGPYDRRPGRSAMPAPDPPSSRSGGGDQGLKGSGAIPASGTVTLADSLTYTAAADVTVQGPLTVRADQEQRPVLRLPVTPGGWTEWRFTGGPIADGGNGNCLVLDGLFLSGADLVLAGEFDCVTLSCCTLDPGDAAPPPGLDAPQPSPFAAAADGRDLVPCRLWIEGTIGTLTVDRCITGPIGTRGTGQVDSLAISESIVQAIPTGGLGGNPVDTAILLADGDVILTRCTVLGPVAVHRLQASECILQDLVQVDDPQHGCVRFSAWVDRSTVPRPYESVRIRQGAALFTTTQFGQPGYGQLLPMVDAAILPQPNATPAAAPAIAAGAQNGSEMGAFGRELNPIKERGLLIKYREYMPAGLVPVAVHVT